MLHYKRFVMENQFVSSIQISERERQTYSFLHSMLSRVQCDNFERIVEGFCFLQ